MDDPRAQAQVLTTCLSQYGVSISTSIRTNIDFAFLFADNILSNVVNLHKHYGGACGNFREFHQIFKRLTCDYQVMIVKLSRTKTADVVDNVFWIKARTVPDFRAGCRELWEFHKRYSVETNVEKTKDSKVVEL
jgi:hypothetical protein